MPLHFELLSQEISNYSLELFVDAMKLMSLLPTTLKYFSTLKTSSCFAEIARAVHYKDS